jgi:CDP-glycerol glycerophosphotransferase (TagB/SpsB family)
MHPEWGKEKADAYYDRWRNMPNTQLADGEFVNLFQGSDAMVHDSGSFVVDYLYFQKPVMYVSQDIQRAKSYANIPGQQAYDAHYIGRTCDDVAHFVEHVVLSGQDTMQARRQTFYQEFLAQPGGQSTAQNIYQDIIHQLCKQSS